MSGVPRLNRRCVPGPAPLGAFVRDDELGGDSRGEWVASVTQPMDVVVGDADATPSPLGIAKALSIIQSRPCLERRAVQLLVPLTKEPGSWRLVTPDFGAQARIHECEFLMCFAFAASDSQLSITRPCAEIGFALMASGAEVGSWDLNLSGLDGSGSTRIDHGCEGLTFDFARRRMTAK